MAFYCYGASEELVRDNFNEGVLGAMQPALIWLARTGLAFLCVSAMKDFYCTLVRKFAMHFGGEDSRIIARLMTSLEQLEHAMQRIKPELLADKNTQDYVSALENNSIAPLTSIINEGLDDNEETGLLNTNKTPGWGDWLASKCCFWYTAPSTVVANPDIVSSQIYNLGSKRNTNTK